MLDYETVELLLLEHTSVCNECGQPLDAWELEASPTQYVYPKGRAGICQMCLELQLMRAQHG